MSSNKSKYYQITTNIIVKANSQQDALTIANRQRGHRALPGEVLAKESTAVRISASAARDLNQITS